MYISEDPIKDGLNWYAYCAGNPVMFADPWGLTMLLSGTASEMGSILRDLQELTDNTLELRAILDSEGVSTGQYEVYISEYSDTINYASGNELIGRMIANENTVTISLRYGKGSATDYDFNSQDARNGIGINATVYLNPNHNSKILTINPTTGDVSYTAGMTPLYIILAHELIHADRAMRGAALNITEWGENTYQVAPYKKGFWIFTRESNKKTERVRQEELATIGIGYHNADDITENMIRTEHGLRLRGAYYVS